MAYYVISRDCPYAYKPYPSYTESILSKPSTEVDMKAAWYKKQGPAQEVIEVGEWPRPDLGAGQVRVRLVFSGLNPSDIKRRKGFRGQPHAFEVIIPNSDGAGIVSELGAGIPMQAP